MYDNDNFKNSSNSKDWKGSPSSPASSDEIKFRNIERHDGGAYFCGLDFITLLDLTSYRISKNLKINFSE